MTWEKLSLIKESNPVELAEYAMAKGIDKEAAFAWWVPFTIKKRDRIIAAVTNRVHKRQYKFGIFIPTSVKEALEEDQRNGNTFWQDAINKEMENVKVAFKILDDNKDILPGYKEMQCHIIFDVKMDNFKRKARLVAGGHMIDTPPNLKYASVESQESVRIALTIAALNDLQVKAGDIQNAYLTAPCAKRIWTICGPEFGANAGKRAIIIRALYGLASAGALFRKHLADCMEHIGYKSC